MIVRHSCATVDLASWSTREASTGGGVVTGSDCETVSKMARFRHPDVHHSRVLSGISCAEDPLLRGSVDRAGWHDPLAGLGRDRSDPIEVGVVMKDDQALNFGGGGYQEVRHLPAALMP